MDNITSEGQITRKIRCHIFQGHFKNLRKKNPKNLKKKSQKSQKSEKNHEQNLEANHKYLENLEKNLKNLE